MTRLEDVTLLIVDCEHKTAPKSDKGHPLIRTTDLGSARIDFRTAQRIDSQTYERWTRRAAPEPGDVILAREAPVGPCGIVPPGHSPALGQRTVLIRPDPDVVDPKYLGYLLAGPQMQETMWSIANGATTPHLNMEDIRRLSVPSLPSRDVQSRVSDVLSALDDAMETNHRRIEILEEVAQSLYDEWFVRYRFPGYESEEFVSSQLGETPRTWRLGRLADVAELKRKNINPGRFPEEVFAHCSIPAYDAGQLPSMERGASIKAGKFVVDRKMVLVSKLNPRIRRVWLAEQERSYRTVCSTEFLPLHNEDQSWLVFLYGLVKSESMAAAITGLSGGTSTSHQRAKPEDFLRLPIVIPDSEVVLAYADHVRSSIDLAATLRVQRKVLADTRELLLPRFLTGEIDIESLDVDDVYGWTELAKSDVTTA